MTIQTMRLSRAFLITILLTFITSSALEAQTLPQKPDFAFPKKVMTDAEKVIKSYPRLDMQKPADANLMLRAWIQYYIATTEVNRADAPAVIAKMERVLAEAPKGDFRAMLTVLLARFYGNFYRSDQWRYDQRELPLTPVPEDITEWSGAMFKQRIDSLCDLSAAEASGSPLKPYLGAVEGSDLELECYPTVRDFVLCQCVALCEITGRNPKSFINAGVEASATGSAPRMAWELQQLQNSYDRESMSATTLMEKFYALATAPGAGEWAALPVLSLADDASTSEMITVGGTKQVSAKVAVDAIDAQLKAYPKSQFAKLLRGAHKMLCKPSVNLSYKEQSAITELEVAYKAVNASRFKILAYRVPDYMVTDRSGIALKSLGAPVAVEAVDINQQPPFAVNNTVKIKLPSNGYYVLVAQGPGMSSPAKISVWSSLTRVVPIVPVALGSVKNPMAVVVDSRTGAAKPGLKVTATTDRRRNNVSTSSETNDIGAAQFNLAPGSDSRRLTVQYEGQSFPFSSPILYTADGLRGNHKSVTARVLTDRALYHPGDALRFVAACARVESTDSGTDSRVASGMNVTVKLRNANYEVIDSLTAITDDFGRASGEFTLPKEGLTGRFSIHVWHEDDNIGSGGVMVSDYRMPQMHITDLETQRDVPQVGSVTVTGCVMTYSGLPVDNAEVQTTLFAISPIRWFAQREN